MAYQLWALHRSAGQAILRRGHDWFLVSIDNGWEPHKLRDEKEALRWAMSVPAISSELTFESLRAAVAYVRQICLSGSNASTLSFNDIRHLLTEYSPKSVANSASKDVTNSPLSSQTNIHGEENYSDSFRPQTNLTPSEQAHSSPIQLQRGGTGSLQRSSFVTLDLQDVNEKIVVKAKGHILLGRADKDSRWRPTVDLTPYGAIEKGVSRIHADLYFEGDKVFVVELGSANGTHLNGVALQMGSAQPIHNGDQLELGRLRMRIYWA